MPLKHATETFLVFLLGVAIALTGLMVSTLPDIPQGTFPWGVILVISILYPVSLVKLFRKNRADHSFRLLHWFPMLVVVLWMVLQIGVSFYPPLAKVAHNYTWGWTLPAVVVGVVLIAIFCLRVVRRRAPRMILLLIVLVPFAVGAMVSERGADWNKELAQVLWEAEWWGSVQNGISGTGSKTEVAIEEKDQEPEKNLKESEDPAEEAWRERLRAFERRRQMIALQLEEDNGESNGPQESPAPKTGTGREFREASTSPTSLPSSGAGVGFLGLTMMMAYCGVLHQRAKKRVI